MFHVTSYKIINSFRGSNANCVTSAKRVNRCRVSSYIIMFLFRLVSSSYRAFDDYMKRLSAETANQYVMKDKDTDLDGWIDR